MPVKAFLTPEEERFVEKCYAGGNNILDIACDETLTSKRITSLDILRHMLKQQHV